MGHSSIHPELDDLLLANGITKRPKKLESTVYIAVPEQKLTLSFQMQETYAEDAMLKQRSPGRYVFNQVTFEAGCPHPLPYGLTLKLSRDELARRLDAPREEHPAGPSATYYKDGLVITINWKTKSPKEAYVRFCVPEIYDKENLGI